MPLINRIEVSNFMNAVRRSPWQPTWPHSVFSLQGLHSVINMPNGRGKTTLVKAVLFILAGDTKRLNQLRNEHFAPKSQGHYSHVRVQMTMDTEEAAGLDLFTGAPLGQQMVFGVFANSGENEHCVLYAYPGTFEDCPVHQMDVGKTIHLVSNEVFEGCLAARPGKFPASAKDATRHAWTAFIARRFDVANLQQQIIYQINAGAEGKSSYFEVPRSSLEYSAAVFYEHLAPQLLTDVMGGYGAEDERSIEDTIHEKARQVAQARFKSEVRKNELADTERVLQELQRIGDAAEELAAAKAEKANCLEKLSLELAVLRNIVVDKPIYGLPPRPPADVPEITKHLIMVEGVPYMPDQAFKFLTGDEPRRINERAMRLAVQSIPVDNSQAIEITCDIKTERDERGKPNKAFNHESVMSLLRRTEAFIPGLDKDSAIADVERAFEWAKVHGDTNPARLELTSLSGKLATRTAEQKANHEERESLTNEKTNLFQEQRQVGEQQAEFRRMQDSGLFTPEEIASPAATGEQTAKARAEAEVSLRIHDEQVARREEVFVLWQDFTRQNPECSPRDVIDAMIVDEVTAQGKVDDLKQQREVLYQQRSGLKEASAVVRRNATVLKARLKQATDTEQLSHMFDDVFSGEDPNGLDQQVKNDLKTANSEKFRISNEIAQISEEVKSIAAFRECFGTSDPGTWLKVRSCLYEQAQRKKHSLTTELDEARISLKNLQEFSIAPGQYARAVAREVQVSFTPLHAEVERLNLSPQRKERILTLFSALLFAPVLEDEDSAVVAARNLAAKGIEFPVFVRSDFEQFCVTGEVAHGNDVARGLFIGVRTRAIDCLLDVNLVEREKKYYDVRIAALSTRLQRLIKAIGRLSHETPNARLAERARQSLESGVLEKDKSLQEALIELEQDLPRLHARFEAIPSIMAVLRHREALDGLTMDALKGHLADAEEALADAEMAEGSTENEITAITFQVDEASARLKDVSTVRGSNEVILDMISKFMADTEHGPEFMSSATAVRSRLQAHCDVTRSKSGFRFNLAQQFVTSGSQRPQEIEARIGEITVRVKLIWEEQSKLSGEIAALQELHLDLAKKVNQIDEFMSSLTRFYKKYKHLPTETSADLSRHGVYRACSYLRGADKIDECIRWITTLKGEVEAMKDVVSGLAGDLRETEGVYERAIRNFNFEIERVTGESTLKISEHQSYLLAQAKTDPSRIREMVAVALSNFGKERLANETARQELDAEWAKMDEWLTEFTKRLPGNLALLKSTFAPKYDTAAKKVIKAGFEIGGEVIRFEDIESVMEDIVRDIEDYEKDNTLRRDTNAKKILRDSFRKGIRDKFYQRVLQNAYIKVCIPAISETPLKLGPNIVSSGQGVAMTLLWIVKLADFVAERERRRKTISTGLSMMAANKLRKVESQFVFIDGAFSHLSDRALIDDVLNGIMQTRGHFQLIVTGHDPEYKHNFEYFPTLICAREIGGRYMLVENGNPVQPHTKGCNLGTMATLRATQISHTVLGGQTSGPVAH
ncbi:hypothetical protein [Geomonas silvestris]|nr:hypothetical protein [Geomonas silvestris]